MAKNHTQTQAPAMKKCKKDQGVDDKPLRKIVAKSSVLSNGRTGEIRSRNGAVQERRAKEPVSESEYASNSASKRKGLLKSRKAKCLQGKQNKKTVTCILTDVEQKSVKLIHPEQDHKSVFKGIWGGNEKFRTPGPNLCIFLPVPEDEFIKDMLSDNPCYKSNSQKKPMEYWEKAAAELPTYQGPWCP
ncbi:UNVERIFIED_CONTAM: hypothetical protein FKN15_037000 [Acipenser sinensis]